MMMMKSVIWWRKPEYPEETTDLRQVTDETLPNSSSTVSEPYAVRTYLGWCVQGPSGGETHEVYAHFVTLERQVENLWRLEVEDDIRGMSVEDEKVIRLWDSEVRYEDGHYSLPIPWRGG